LHKKRKLMQKPTISIEKNIHAKCPNARLGCLLAKVKIASSTPTLLEFSQKTLSDLTAGLSIAGIHGVAPLQEARSAYKLLGKDPSRYRPSAEALLRRVVQGKGLYQVNNVVDALNLVSVKSGFSIGGYDLDKIQGEIKWGVGKENEPYQAIGRGALNIHNLPLLRDTNGAFGSPTSDSTRTMVTEKTTSFLATFFDFGKNMEAQDAMNKFGQWLEEWGAGEVVEQWEV